MENVYSSLLVILACAVAGMGLSRLYFRRFQITRPPIGVFNLTDIAFMIGGIVLVPYLYLLVPLWLVGGLLVLCALSVVYFLWEPVLRSPPVGLAGYLRSHRRRYMGCASVRHSRQRLLHCE